MTAQPPGRLPKDLKKLRPCEMLWETRDGKRIRVSSMKDAHLLNAILYVERNADLLQANSVSDVIDDDDIDWSETTEAFLVAFAPYRKIYNEARRRRLVVAPVNSWYAWGYDTPLPDL